MWKNVTVVRFSASTDQQYNRRAEQITAARFSTVESIVIVSLVVDSDDVQYIVGWPIYNNITGNQVIKCF